eukprot:COSAG06_NODE_29544_length_554_cov_1.294505_1_plen_72_part_01
MYPKILKDSKICLPSLTTLQQQLREQGVAHPLHHRQAERHQRAGVIRVVYTGTVLQIVLLRATIVGASNTQP